MALYEQRLTEDLSNIEDEVGRLGAAVEAALRDAVKSSLDGNTTLANETVLGDKRINRKQEEISRLCFEFMAVHLPMAGHLREVASILRVASELERIGDYAVTIAREALQLPHKPTGVVRQEMKEMADLAETCLENSLRAFTEKDLGLARETWARASQARERIDTINADLVREFEREDEGIRYLLDMLISTYRLKRVSERTKNICQEVEFTVTGEIPAPKTAKILFLDSANNCQSQIAEAVARRRFADLGEYMSAGRTDKEPMDPTLVSFLESRGLVQKGVRPKVLDAGPDAVAEFDVVVSLDGPVAGYVAEQPFRTVFLEWDVGGPPEGPPEGPDAAEEHYKALYREISARVRDLMESLYGEETA